MHWRRYEIENYFVTPGLLQRYANAHLQRHGLIRLGPEVDAVLDSLMLARVFRGSAEELRAYHEAPPAAAALVWTARTERLKLSDFAETFFRDLAAAIGGPMLLTKGALHRLVADVDAHAIAPEVIEKLDLLLDLLEHSAAR